MSARHVIRRLVEPAPHSTRRIPAGLARGIRFAAEPAATASADLWVGLFESELAASVRRLARPGVVSVDVGANSGYYTLVLAAHCRAPVLAYEPDPAARERLRRNLALNPGLAAHVDVRSCAVGERAAEGTVSLDDELLGRDNAPAVGLLKVDVDGGEHAVLTGARGLLQRARPHVIVETHSPALEHACAALLRDAGYRPRVLTARRHLAQNRAAEHNRWLVAESGSG